MSTSDEDKHEADAGLEQSRPIVARSIFTSKLHEDSQQTQENAPEYDARRDTLAGGLDLDKITRLIEKSNRAREVESLRRANSIAADDDISDAGTRSLASSRRTTVEFSRTPEIFEVEARATGSTTGADSSGLSNANIISLQTFSVMDAMERSQQQEDEKEEKQIPNTRDADGNAGDEFTSQVTQFESQAESLPAAGVDETGVDDRSSEYLLRRQTIGELGLDDTLIAMLTGAAEATERRQSEARSSIMKHRGSTATDDGGSDTEVRARRSRRMTVDFSKAPEIYEMEARQTGSSSIAANEPDSLEKPTGLSNANIISLQTFSVMDAMVRSQEDEKVDQPQYERPDEREPVPAEILDVDVASMEHVDLQVDDDVLTRRVSRYVVAPTSGTGDNIPLSQSSIRAADAVTVDILNRAIRDDLCRVPPSGSGSECHSSQIQLAAMIVCRVLDSARNRAMREDRLPLAQTWSEKAQREAVLLVEDVLSSALIYVGRGGDASSVNVDPARTAFEIDLTVEDDVDDDVSIDDAEQLASTVIRPISSEQPQKKEIPRTDGDVKDEREKSADVEDLFKHLQPLSLAELDIIEQASRIMQHSRSRMMLSTESKTGKPDDGQQATPPADHPVLSATDLNDIEQASLIMKHSSSLLAALSATDLPPANNEDAQYPEYRQEDKPDIRRLSLAEQDIIEHASRIMKHGQAKMSNEQPTRGVQEHDDGRQKEEDSPTQHPSQPDGGTAASPHRSETSVNYSLHGSVDEHPKQTVSVDTDQHVVRSLRQMYGRRY